MKKLIFIYTFLLIMLITSSNLIAAYYPPGEGPGDPGRTYVRFRGTAVVKDEAGNPVENIKVTMYANYFVYTGGDWDGRTASVSGYTNAYGVVTLYKSVDVTNYYPSYYSFHLLNIKVTEPGYTTLTSNNNLIYSPVGTASFVVVHDEDGNSIHDEWEMPLAQKFCPVLILNSGDHSVAPEPVEIMKVDMTNPDNYFYTDLWNFSFDHYYDDHPRTNEEWIISGSHVENTYKPCGNDLICSGGNYSHYPGSFTILADPPGLEYGHYIVVFHPDWGGPGCDTPDEWYSLYSQIGDDYPHTIYPHIFKNGNDIVIQYWFFYPFNAWVNRHEGDWEHINVIINSQNPAEAELVRVEYFFHHYVLSRNPDQILRSDGTHPFVFVGGTGSINIGLDWWSGHGSHGSYPTYGHWQETGAKPPLMDRPDEYVDGLGMAINHSDFILKIIPNPSSIDFDEHPEMSWLKANIAWGELVVESSPDYKYTHSDIPVVDCVVDLISFIKGKPHDRGNMPPPGPAQSDGWNDIGSSPNGKTYINYTKTPPLLGIWPILPK